MIPGLTLKITHKIIKLVFKNNNNKNISSSTNLVWMTFRVDKFDVSCEVVIELLYKIHTILAFQKSALYSDSLCTESDNYVAIVNFTLSNFYFYFSYIFYIRYKIIEEGLDRKAIKYKHIIRIIL